MRATVQHALAQGDETVQSYTSRTASLQSLATELNALKSRFSAQYESDIEALIALKAAIKSELEELKADRTGIWATLSQIGERKSAERDAAYSLIDNRLKLFPNAMLKTARSPELFEQYTADLETIQADMHSIATANPTGYLKELLDLQDDIERAKNRPRPIRFYRRDAHQKYALEKLKEELIETHQTQSIDKSKRALLIWEG